MRGCGKQAEENDERNRKARQRKWHKMRFCNVSHQSNNRNKPQVSNKRRTDTLLLQTNRSVGRFQGNASSRIFVHCRICKARYALCELYISSPFTSVINEVDVVEFNGIAYRI